MRAHVDFSSVQATTPNTYLNTYKISAGYSMSALDVLKHLACEVANIPPCQFKETRGFALTQVLYAPSFKILTVIYSSVSYT